MLFLILLTTIYVTSEAFKLDTKFEKLQECLKEEGFNLSNIAARSDSDKYNSLNYQWQLRGPLIDPLAYVLVQNEQDIQKVVTCSKKVEIRIVPKGGGHSFEKYSFGDSHSVVVDLRNMSSIEVKASSMTTTVGPGVLIGVLLTRLWFAGKFFIPTGFCPTVGISGVSTGGGYGYLSRTYGITTDQIIEMNVVIANGTLLKVNNVSNSDLFWALRGGGGGGFGIVSKFVFKIRPAPPVIFFGVLEYDGNMFPAVFSKWQEYFAGIPPRTMFSQILVTTGNIRITFADSSGENITFNNIKQILPAAVNTSGTFLSFDNFLLTQSNSVQSGEFFQPNFTLNSIADMGNLMRESQARNYLKAKSFFVKSIPRNDVIDLFYILMKEIPAGIQVWFDTFGGAISDPGIHDTAFVHRANTIYLALGYYITLNPTPEENRRGLGWLQKFYDCGTLVFNSTETYQNYADADLNDYLQRYYASNLPRLVEIKKKYDPQNCFNNPQSIPTHL